MNYDAKQPRSNPDTSCHDHISLLQLSNYMVFSEYTCTCTLLVIEISKTTYVSSGPHLTTLTVHLLYLSLLIE